MNAISAEIYDFLVSQATHLAVLFFVTWGIVALCRKKSAHLRYLLWGVILVKCLMPPLFTVPVAVLPQSTVTLPVIESTAVVVEHSPFAVNQPLAPVVLPAATLPNPEQNAVASFPVVEQPTSERIIGWRTLQTRQWTLLVWAAGLIVLLLGTCVRAIRFARMLTRSRVEIDDHLGEKIQTLAQTFRPGLTVKAYQLEDISQPFVWGILKGVIYLPANFARTSTENKRCSVLLHEIAHVVRLDPLVNFIQVVAQALYWFHPMVWVANHRIRAEREKCCDEIAIAKFDTTPKEYGSAIIDTLMHEYKSRMAVPTLAVAGPVKNLEDRIKTIMKPGKQFYSRPSFKMFAMALMLAVVTIPTAIALTQRTHEEEGTFASKTNPIPESGSNVEWTEIFIPDIDESESPAILVLDTHQLIQIQDDSDPAAFQQWIEEMQQIAAESFLVYDHASSKRALIMVQGLGFLGIQAGRPGLQEPITQFINNGMPEQFSMTSSKGQVYEFSVLTADSQGCRLSYRPSHKRPSSVQAQVMSTPVQNASKTLQSLFMAGGMLCQSIQEALEADDFETALALCQQVETHVDQGLKLADNVIEGAMFKALATQFRLWHDVIEQGDKARALKMGEMLNQMGGNMAPQVESMVTDPETGSSEGQDGSVPVKPLSYEDRRELVRLMTVYARVTFSKDLHGAEAIFNFESEAQRQRVLDMMRQDKTGLSSGDKETQPVHVVQIDPTADNRALVSALCPLGGRYIAHSVSWVKIDGQWKVAIDWAKMMDMQAQVKTMGAEAYGRLQIKTQLESWENAQGAALVSLYESARKQAQFHVQAMQFAKLKGLSMHAGMTEAQNQEQLVQILAQSPEAFRREMIAQYRRQLGPAEKYGKLEFRMLYDTVASEGLPRDMTMASEQQLRDRLKDSGPSGMFMPGQTHVWLPLRPQPGTSFPDAIIETYQGQDYILVSNQSEEIMTADGSWGLLAVSPQADAMGRRAINLELDQPGGDRLRRMTGKNLHRAMAIVLDGQVLSVPTIAGTIGPHMIITGQFTYQEIRDMMVSLQKGMRPTSVETPMP